MPPTSLRMISIFLPATVSPCCFMYSLAPLRIWMPVSANGPDSEMIMPILTVSCALAAPPNKAAASKAEPATTIRFIIILPWTIAVIDWR